MITDFKIFENIEIFDNEFPIINGDYIGDLFIREKIPNMGSIESSLNNYKILNGIREVSFSRSFPEYQPHYYSLSVQYKTHMLIEQIKVNKEINPLIVVIDNDGPYILEGSHRFDALKELGIDLFPAKIVLDLELLTLLTENIKQKPVVITGYAYHSSNPINRKSILEKGLIPQKGEQRLTGDPYGKSIFVTNTEDKNEWFDSTYDDDVFRIDISKIPNVTWYTDYNMGKRLKHHVLTFDSIPPESIELVYKGSGVDKLKKNWKESRNNILNNL